MFAFLSYLRQIRQSAQQSNSSSSSNQKGDAPVTCTQVTSQPDNDPSNHTKIPEDTIQRRDSSPTPSNITGTKRTMDSDHISNGETKRHQTTSSKSTSNLAPTVISTSTTVPAPPIISTSALLQAPTILSDSELAKHQTNKTNPSISYSPSIPEVIGRSIHDPASNVAKFYPNKSGRQLNRATRRKNQRLRPRSRSPPTWHRQRRLLFLVLKNHPDHEMPRTDLVTGAVDLDIAFSIERNLPLVFRSKTPRNSASAILTNQDGKNFHSFRPFGSRCLHFRLPFKPANFGEAVTTYRSWMETLITQDWPLCFGYPCKLPHRKTSFQPHPTTIPHSHHVSATTASANITDNRNSSTPSPMFTPSNTEFDYFLTNRKKERHLLHQLNHDDEKITPFDTSMDQDTVTVKEEEVEYSADMVADGDNDEERMKMASQQLQSISETIHWTIRGDPFASPNQPNIPSSWQDIVRVEGKLNESEDEVQDGDSEYEDEYQDYCGTGLSVFAQRRLPANTPIGFYFGTPTTKEEFDEYKENYNCAMKYCVMYQDMVLDATDDNGMPFTDPAKEHTKVYCPFHFMRQVESPQSANVVLLKGNVYNQVICWTKHTIERNEELTVFLERRF